MPLSPIMHCRVVFSSVEHFSGLLDLYKHVTALTGRPMVKKYDASFFLFGEDVLGCAGEYHPPVSYKEITSLITLLQNSIGPRDFVIFSAYTKINEVILNAVYFIGQKQWYLDFKRVPTSSDLVVTGLDMVSWPSTTRLNVKRHLCAKAGQVCLKNVFLLICADITQLHRMRPPKNTLIFVPAGILPKGEVSHLYNFHSTGWVFINDPAQGVFWHVEMKRPLQKKDFQPIPFDGKGSVSFDFDFEP